MRKTIVVMRHAKAKRPVEGSPDIERELSEAGRRSMRATLGYSLGLWPKSAASAEVWSSPAIRAQQTASLLARALKERGVKVGDVQLLDCLWTGDYRALAVAIAASESDTIAIVGHNPFAEELVHELTGSRIIFATGAMAAISIETDDLLPSYGAPETATGDAPAGEEASSTAEPDIPLSSPASPVLPTPRLQRLLWFAQGPISQKWKTLVSMEKILAGGADTIQSRLQGFFDDPDDVETMHKLRVSIRTLRSLVAFVKPWQDAAQNAKAQSDLRDVVAITSRLRELDVLAEQAGEAAEGSSQLVDFCLALAAEERAAVSKALCDKRTRKKLDRVCADMKNVRWKSRYVKEGLEASEVRARFDEMAESLRADLDSLDLAEVERTHDVRKRAKRVRYSAEQFKGILGDDAVGIAKNMTAHQDNLGAICDARVNIDIISAFDPAELPEPVAWDLALLRAKNETFLYSTLRSSR